MEGPRGLTPFEKRSRFLIGCQNLDSKIIKAENVNLNAASIQDTRKPYQLTLNNLGPHNNDTLVVIKLVLSYCF